MPNVAAVLGANGITGSYLIEHLLAQPASEWSKVIATSRRDPNPDWVAKDLPPGAMQSGRLAWFNADLLNDSVDKLASDLTKAGGSEITHVFWGAYLLPPQGNGSVEEIEANRLMWENTMQAMVKVNTGNLKRVVLQLGWLDTCFGFLWKC
jgi:nucleoside-diphosphate-sugar epimerase